MDRRPIFGAWSDDHTSESRYDEVSSIEVVDVFRCRECGTLVTDRKAHDEHHSRTDW